MEEVDRREKNWQATEYLKRLASEDFSDKSMEIKICYRAAHPTDPEEEQRLREGDYR